MTSLGNWKLIAVIQLMPFQRERERDRDKHEPMDPETPVICHMTAFVVSSLMCPHALFSQPSPRVKVEDFWHHNVSQ